MAKWLIKEFDWSEGKYTGNYIDADYYVDSTYGLDTNAGTKTAPFRTISQAILTANSTGGNGTKIAINGIFDENFPTQSYWYEFIGCGGGRNGRAVFRYKATTGEKPTLRSSAKYQNIETLDYVSSRLSLSLVQLYLQNCYFKYLTVTGSGTRTFHIYNSIISEAVYTSSGGTHHITFRGHNNTYYNNSVGNFSGSRLLLGSNNHYNINIFSSISGGGNMSGDGQYLDPDRGNFNVQITSPLLFGGTVDELTGIAEHVGVAKYGQQFTGLSYAFTPAGGAVLENVTVNSAGLISIDSGNVGKVRSGIIDLGQDYLIERLDINNVFDFSNGVINKLIDSSSTRAVGTSQSATSTTITLSATSLVSEDNNYYNGMEIRIVGGTGEGQVREVTGYVGSTKVATVDSAWDTEPDSTSQYEIIEKGRVALDCFIQYGSTLNELNTCPKLNVEYGKQPTFSGAGVNRVGNADNSFDETVEQEFSARFLIVEFELKNI